MIRFAYALFVVLPGGLVAASVPDLRPGDILGVWEYRYKSDDEYSYLMILKPDKAFSRQSYHHGEFDRYRSVKGTWDVRGRKVHLSYTRPPKDLNLPESFLVHTISTPQKLVTTITLKRNSPLRVDMNKRE